MATDPARSGGEGREAPGAGGAGPQLEVRFTLEAGSLELDVSLSSAASTLAVVGPSGAGKTTLLRTIAGLERRARGRVVFRGDVWQDSEADLYRPPWERGVGWAPQEALLFPHLSVRENLGYGGAAEAEVEEVARLLEVKGLLERRPRRLSGGERQRIALGRSLLASPRLLLLDEPLSALDRPLRNEVGERLEAYARERDVPVVLVTHDEADVRALAEERWILSEGRIRAG